MLEPERADPLDHDVENSAQAEQTNAEQIKPTSAHLLLPTPPSLKGSGTKPGGKGTVAPLRNYVKRSGKRNRKRGGGKS